MDKEWNELSILSSWDIMDLLGCYFSEAFDIRIAIKEKYGECTGRFSTYGDYSISEVITCLRDLKNLL